MLSKSTEANWRAGVREIEKRDVKLRTQVSALLKSRLQRNPILPIDGSLDGINQYSLYQYSL